MTDEPADESADAALRRARRAVAKATHPDHGGDADTHRAAMEALSGLGPDTSLAGAARRRVRALARLPREVRDAYREGRDTPGGEEDQD